MSDPLHVGDEIEVFVGEKSVRFRVGDVPCNGCTRCCHGDAIRLLPGDDPAEYLVEPHNVLEGQWMLAHKPDGDCIYLEDSGCGIHERRPLICREMDCRLIARTMTYTEVRKLKFFPTAVWKKGRELLQEMS